jgi:hypothetical protein
MLELRLKYPDRIQVNSAASNKSTIVYAMLGARLFPDWV